MATIQYAPNREIPVIADCDVVVVGGGPGGIGAAVMAARAGARTVLLERYGFLGGMAASGEVHPFMPNALDGEELDGPVYLEWRKRAREYYFRPVKNDKVDRFISKDAAILAAEELCLDAGVRILYHHTFADAVVSGRMVDSAVFLSKSGYGAVRAPVFVDCTGDGDLAARAGCSFEMGGSSGYCQPMTTCFKLCGVDPVRRASGTEINQLYDEARARGEIDCPRENVLIFPWYEEGVLHFNTTRILHRDATDGVQLSEAELEGHAQVRAFLNFFRTRVPGFEQVQLYSIAHHVGIRESRRICGRAWLTREDFVGKSKFPDAIARVRYMIDIHNPEGSGTEKLHMEPGEWYEIPFGCVVTKDRDNLLVGGRPISVDHAIHSSMRVMPPACTVGQATGMAGALAVRQGCMPSDLDGVTVRASLKEMGANL